MPISLKIFQNIIGKFLDKWRSKGDEDDFCGLWILSLSLLVSINLFFLSLPFMKIIIYFLRNFHRKPCVLFNFDGKFCLSRHIKNTNFLITINLGWLTCQIGFSMSFDWEKTKLKLHNCSKWIITNPLLIKNTLH